MSSNDISLHQDVFNPAYHRLNNDEFAAESSERLSSQGSADNETGQTESPDKSKWPKVMRYTRYALCSLLVSAIILAIYAVIAVAWHSHVYSRYDPAPYVYNYNPALSLGSTGGTIFATSKAAGLGTSSDNPIKVTLIGDSLINHSWLEHDLEGKLTSRLAKHTDLFFQFTNHGVNGDEISDILPRLVPEVWADGSSVVIMLWDSDEADATPPDAEDATVESQYSLKLDWAIGNLTSLPNVKFVAISGPALNGEGWEWLKQMSHADSPQMDEQLEQYRALNIAAAQKHQVTYIDMRHAFLSTEWGAWPLYWGWCTDDGEHFDDMGTSIQADNFVQFLLY